MQVIIKNNLFLIFVAFLQLTFRQLHVLILDIFNSLRIFSKPVSAILLAVFFSQKKL